MAIKMTLRHFEALNSRKPDKRRPAMNIAAFLSQLKTSCYEHLHRVARRYIPAIINLNTAAQRSHHVVPPRREGGGSIR